MDELAKILLQFLSSETFLAVDSMGLKRYLAHRQSVHYQQQDGVPKMRMEGGVAVVDVKGVLVRHPYWLDEISTLELAKTLQQLASDENVSAVVLDIDSPGGSAVMPELMASASTLAAAKPLFAYTSEYCCSAAFKLACTAGRVYAGPQSTVGSIGTILTLYDWSVFFKNWGIEPVAITTGEFKSLGFLGAAITESHRAYLAERVQQIHEKFREAVQTGRGLSEEEYNAVADGRVWWSDEAVGLKLIDGVKTFAETLVEAAAERGPSAALQGTKSMSQENETPKGPQAASLEELRENLPGVSDSFLVEQLEKKATLPAAMKAYMAAMSAERESLAKEKAEAEAKAEAAEKKAAVKTTESKAPRGNKPIQTAVDSSDESAPSKEGYWHQHAAYVAQGKTRREAARLMHQRHRSLEDALVAAANSK